MKVIKLNTTRESKYTLRDYTRLVFAFFGSLVLIAFYQQFRLYADGVLDTLLNKNLLLLWLHHCGFTAILSLFLVFIFNGLESKKPGWGFKFSVVVFIGVLLLEVLLTEYYTEHYEILGKGFLERYLYFENTGSLLIQACIGLLILGTAFRTLYRATDSLYTVIGKMYPFTIILFTLFLATLFSDKKEVNLNKTQYLITDYINELTGSTVYRGEDPYPLWKPWKPSASLLNRLDWPETPPNIVLLSIEGLSNDFVGEKGALRIFTPFLDSLSKQSLYLENHLSNIKESANSLPVISSSLPMGEEDFTKLRNSPNRLSLFSLLKKNGYRTAFQFGGNLSLKGWGRFLFEERVDEIIDRKSFGNDFDKLPEDAAGGSLGYPDAELYKRYLDNRITTGEPRFDYFHNLSSSYPYRFPEQETLLEEVRQMLEENNFDSKQRRFIRRNQELIAAMRYADRSLKEFISAFSGLPEYRNTLFIVTGSHHSNEFPASNTLEEYRVPFFFFGPLLKKPEVISNISSHMDIAPGLLGNLGEQYGLELPEKASWLGQGFELDVSTGPKMIPLYRFNGSLRDMINDEIFLNGNRIYQVEEALKLKRIASGGLKDSIKEILKDFRAIGSYVTASDKIIPATAVPFEKIFRKPDKKQMVWIQSVFNSRDFDDAYTIARELALDGDREKALLMCNYILTEVPGHVDTEILMGRINAWNGQYEEAIAILEQVVQKYPVYDDCYSALLDVYFWSDQNRRALYLKPLIEKHMPGNSRLKAKMQLAMEQLAKQQASEVSAGPKRETQGLIAKTTER
ncbi:sulfatase-like hydrolase/transferase [Robiginitalea sp. IMCC44478]|uniref:sulfatase-like hydrolase/transferase n=1 Tax=Robiginitalea sp. IMCC44478 TaxID=3459122 RepID=UPI0040425033